MVALADYWHGLLDRYRALSLRERVLVGATLLTATWSIWAVTLGDWQYTSLNRMEVSVESLQREVVNARAERRQLETVGVADANERLRRERNRLDGKLREMDASLGTLLDRFVAPERMPTLLEDVMGHFPGLTLVRVESLPAEPMEVSAATGGEAPSAAVLIYRHPLRIDFQGGYFEVMAFLNEIEAGAWRFGWRRLDYQVTDYPIASVTVEIETLSRERSWIGV